MLKRILSAAMLGVASAVIATNAGAWEAKVVDILQHGSYVAVYLSPDPGVGSCSYGSPYLLSVEGTPASNQRFGMVLTALATGKSLAGYDDGCNSAIWAQSRPIIVRLMLKNK